MKKLLSKVFFVSDGAKGMLFALTLVTVGNYLWFSFFIMASLWIGRIYPACLMAHNCGFILITLYSLALAVVALTGLIKLLRRDRDFRVLWRFVPAVLLFAAGVAGVILVFPPLNVLLGLSGMIISGFDGLWLGGCVLIGEPWLSRGLPGLPPAWWGAGFGLSLGLILAGGLFAVSVFTAAEKKRFRSAFGAPTLAVYGILAGWYVFTLGLALYESCEVSKVRAAVERRFGRPLTAVGVEALYREQGKTDAEFWERQEKDCKALPQFDIDGDPVAFCDLRLPDRPAGETLAWYDKLCRENRAAIVKYEKRFDRVPPMPEKEFVPGNLSAVTLDELMQCRNFVRRLERSRLIRALAAKDVDAAWACYRRMGNVCAFLGKEPWLIGSLVWAGVCSDRLDALEKLLESRLLADAKLDEIDAELAALERDIPGNVRQTMYSEAAFGQDAIYGLETGLTDVAGLFGEGQTEVRMGAFASYRWLFPQYWFHAALDKRDLLRFYLLPDPTVEKGLPHNDLLLMSRPITASLCGYGRRIRVLTARVRGMRVLIRAEKYRRKHGEFPKTLADLPLDPFTGKPLLYEVGKAEVLETVWKKPVSSSADEVKTTVDAVSVRSPAEDLSESTRDPEKGIDRTRAMIRIRYQKNP